MIKRGKPKRMTPNFCHRPKALMRLIFVISALLPMQDGKAGPKASNYCHSIQSAAANGYSVNRNESCEDLSTGKYYKTFNAYCAAMKKSSDPYRATGCQ